MGFLKRLFGSAEPTDEPKKERHPLEESVNYYYPTSDTDIALMKTSVAGITHHMKLTDAPVVVQGHTRFEPENPYNKKAVALITDDGRQIGYIADRELSLYYDIFADRDGIRFYGGVGIFRNDQNRRTLYGKIMLVDVPESDDGRLFDLGQKQLDYMMADFTSK